MSSSASPPPSTDNQSQEQLHQGNVGGKKNDVEADFTSLEEELERQYKDYKADFDAWQEKNKHMSDTETYRNYVANFEKWEKEVEKRRAQLKQQKQRAVAQQKASTLGALAKQAHKRIKLNETSSSHQSNTEPPPDSIVYGKLPEPKPRSTIESHQPPPVSLLRSASTSSPQSVTPGAAGRRSTRWGGPVGLTKMTGAADYSDQVPVANDSARVVASVQKNAAAGTVTHTQMHSIDTDAELLDMDPMSFMMGMVSVFMADPASTMALLMGDGDQAPSPVSQLNATQSAAWPRDIQARVERSRALAGFDGQQPAYKVGSALVGPQQQIADASQIGSNYGYGGRREHWWSSTPQNHMVPMQGSTTMTDPMYERWGQRAAPPTRQFTMLPPNKQPSLPHLQPGSTLPPGWTVGHAIRKEEFISAPKDYLTPRPPFRDFSLK